LYYISEPGKRTV